MRSSRTSIALCLALLAACAGGRDATLSRTLAGLDAARHAFHSADIASQEAIPAEVAARGGTREEAEAALRSHRARRDKVSIAFVAAYTAVATAALEPGDELVEQAYQTAAAALRAAREMGMLP
jgi:hypothetical protein